MGGWTRPICVGPSSSVFCPVPRNEGRDAYGVATCDYERRNEERAYHVDIVQCSRQHLFPCGAHRRSRQGPCRHPRIASFPPLRAVRDGALRITWFIIGFLVLAALGSKSAHGRGQTINMIWIFATIAALIYAVSAVVRIRREHRTQDRQTEQRMRERPVPEGIVYANVPRPSTESADAPAPV